MIAFAHLKPDLALLSEAQRACILLGAKLAYEKMFPGVKPRDFRARGSARRAGKPVADESAEPFSFFAASRCNLSQRSIQRSITIASRVGSNVLTQLVGTPLDRHDKLLALSKMPPADRVAAASRWIAISPGQRGSTEKLLVENPLFAHLLESGATAFRQFSHRGTRIDILDTTSRRLIECKREGSIALIAEAADQLLRYQPHFPEYRLAIAIPFVAPNAKWLAEQAANAGFEIIETCLIDAKASP